MESRDYAYGQMAAAQAVAPAPTAMSRLWACINKLDQIEAGLADSTTKLVGSYPTKDSSGIKAAANGMLDEMHERLARLVDRLEQTSERLHGAL